MFFVLDHDAFSCLVHEISFFDAKEMEGKDMLYAIVMKEFGLSLKILERGWNINCILPKCRDVDYRTLKENFNPQSRYG
jgi:hypothetical protein